MMPILQNCLSYTLYDSSFRFRKSYTIKVIMKLYFNDFLRKLFSISAAFIERFLFRIFINPKTKSNLIVEICLKDPKSSL